MTTAPTRYVALDLETTSLDVRVAEPLEVGYLEFDPITWETLARGVFVPPHDRAVIASADLEALAVNRYMERRLFAKQLEPIECEQVVSELVALLDGATLVGANPAYDSAVLWSWLARRRPDLAGPPWHFRLYDVSLATRILLGLEHTPGLAQAADALGLDPQCDAHTAYADAWTAARIAMVIERHNSGRRDDADARATAKKSRGLDGEHDGAQLPPLVVNHHDVPAENWTWNTDTTALYDVMAAVGGR